MSRTSFNDLAISAGDLWRPLPPKRKAMLAGRKNLEEPRWSVNLGRGTKRGCGVEGGSELQIPMFTIAVD